MPVDRTGAPIYPVLVGIWKMEDFDSLTEARDKADATDLLHLIPNSNYQYVSVYRQKPALLKMMKFRGFFRQIQHGIISEQNIVVLTAEDFE